MHPRFGKGATILIIDDDPDLLPTLADMVRLLTDCAVVTATNGVEGLQQFFATRPDCAIVDVKMPQMDGYQLVRALRGDPATAQTPLILLTALVQERDRFAGLAAGVDQYLTKPVKPQELLAAIRRAIALNEADRERRLQALYEANTPPDGEPR